MTISSITTVDLMADPQQAAQYQDVIPFNDLRHASVVEGGLSLKCLKSSDDKIWWEWAYVHDMLKLRKDIHRYLKQLDLEEVMRKFMLPSRSVHRSQGINNSRQKSLAGDTHVCTSAGLLSMILHMLTTRQGPAGSKAAAWALFSQLLGLVLPLVVGLCFMVACTLPDGSGVWTSQAMFKTTPPINPPMPFIIA